jgi:hypothetical protein
MAHPYFEKTIELEGTLPSYVWISPIVNNVDNVQIETGSSDSPDPDLDSEGRYVTISGSYLKVRVSFLSPDTLRKLIIFKVS